MLSDVPDEHVAVWLLTCAALTGRDRVVPREVLLGEGDGHVRRADVQEQAPGLALVRRELSPGIIKQTGEEKSVVPIKKKSRRGLARRPAHLIWVPGMTQLASCCHEKLVPLPMAKLEFIPPIVQMVLPSAPET